VAPLVTLSEQSEKIPEEYSENFNASTAMETGCLSKADLSADDDL